ncbi:MAG: hydrogenase maturation nickel metallochaperone HypA [Candidatus Korobacteraceae bacterium]|jgi:hydrogenase nickel incorporation protein HypA/HybF
MHEMVIACSILDAVAKEAQRHPGARATKVGVRIGELAAIDPEALRFCFEVMVKGTEQDGLQLEIDRVPRQHQCADCKEEFVIRDYDFRCPRCGTVSVDFASGDELELTFVEVSEDESSSAGTKST